MRVVVGGAARCHDNDMEDVCSVNFALAKSDQLGVPRRAASTVHVVEQPTASALGMQPAIPSPLASTALGRTSCEWRPEGANPAPKTNSYCHARGRCRELAYLEGSLGSLDRLMQFLSTESRPAVNLLSLFDLDDCLALPWRTQVTRERIPGGDSVSAVVAPFRFYRAQRQVDTLEEP